MRDVFWQTKINLQPSKRPTMNLFRSDDFVLDVRALEPVAGSETCVIS